MIDIDELRSVLAAHFGMIIELEASENSITAAWYDPHTGARLSIEHSIRPDEGLLMLASLASAIERRREAGRDQLRAHERAAAALQESGQ